VKVHFSTHRRPRPLDLEEIEKGLVRILRKVMQSAMVAPRVVRPGDAGGRRGGGERS